MACQNKFSLQLTLNFVIIPECCVLETVTVLILWRSCFLHPDYIPASLWINRSIIAFKKTHLSPPSPSFPHIFYSDILAFSFVEANCHLNLRSKTSRIRTRWNTHAHPDFDNHALQLHSSTQPGCELQVKQGLREKGNLPISKALGHHCPSTPSTNTWKSYLWNSPVDKALTKEVRDRGSNTHLTPRRPFCLPGCWSVSSGAIPPPESVLLCSQTPRR